ncbi:hypothetical protein ABVK25_002255 [Lepraria finkii]|uniref:Uncharacterized protein n=1 Tax=Lepraria finkii TaxID=1340010 RepID=A0ABR4BHA3_9LECA
MGISYDLASHHARGVMVWFVSLGSQPPNSKHSKSYQLYILICCGFAHIHILASQASHNSFLFIHMKTRILLTAHASCHSSQPPKMPSTSYVCFPCRTHRSLERYPKKPFENYNSTSPTCHSCKAPMRHIGAKIEIPPHRNINGWELFYDFTTRPWNTLEHLNYCKEIDPERAEENQH